jgi:serine/threonine-protein kinase HipA
VQLSPAYDLVNTTLLLDGATEELALPLNGRKRALTRAMLLKYFARERMGLSARIVEQIEQELQAILPVWDELITHSFLTPERQQRYRALVQERAARLFTRPAE